MTKQISFIHAADLHLDSPFRGLAHTPDSIFEDIRESTFKAFGKLVDTAIEMQVDFVLITGDLFDNEKQSLKAQVRLRRGFEKLDQRGIYVYLSYGNHDYIKGNVHPVTYPDNVFIFPGEDISYFPYEKNGEILAAIYGFSYEKRAVTSNKAAEFYIQDEDIPFHIAMLHGSVESNTEHDTYAPFQTRELLEKGFHYWALGHIHKRQTLTADPPVIYPGNIQGRNRKETGEKGCYHVVMTENEVSMEFIPLQAIQFLSVEIDVSSLKEIHQLEKTIHDKLNKMKLTQPMLVDLSLCSNNSLLRKWENDGLVEEIIELINDVTVYDKNWLFIFRHRNRINDISESIWKEDQFFVELHRQFSETAVQPFLKELYHHRRARKYAAQLTEDEEQEIKHKAEQLLMHELLKE
ncbi:DNA repair exonuclease [Virgibacillus sp. YIM 98842]|uniref:metallophosphoesterase family protein n=1 Tax=Virgibacillus sp. YIM 98842 TaxID=2663533 RepID=UPI0013DC0EEA|nr:DNA repair exonuclease [Virgibacillus sp. YIM 98842]